MLLFRVLATLLAAHLLAGAQTETQCPQVPRKLLRFDRGYLRESMQMRGENPDDEQQMLRLAEQGHAGAIVQLGFLPRSDASLRLLRRLAKSDHPYFGEAVAILALKALAQQHDCAWIELAKQRLPTLGGLNQLDMARYLVSIGDAGGWPYVRDSIVNGKSAQANEVQVAFDLLEDFEKIPGPEAGMTMVDTLPFPSIRSREIRRELLQLRFRLLARRRFPESTHTFR